MSSIVENTVEQYEKMKLTLQNEGAQELHTLFENVLPWTIEAQSARELLKENTQQDGESIARFFDKLFLFKVNEITITDTSDDIAALLYKKQQALITAAYRSGFTLTTMLVGNGGGSVEIFYGVSSTEATSIAKDVFQKQINGVFSGNGIQYIDENQFESRRITEALQGLRHGGMITGVPTQKIDDEKQTFDLTSIIRSMNGQKFVLVIGSRPVSKEIVSQQIGELFELKDRCHALANRTVGFDQSLTDTWSQAFTEGESQAISKGTTNTAGVNIGGTIALGQAITETLTKSTSVSGGMSLGLIGAAVGGAIGSVVPGLGTAVGAKIGEMIGRTANVGISKSTSKSTSTTTIPPMLNGGLNASRAVSKTTTDTTSTSETETSGWSKSKGENLSFEQQNSIAIGKTLLRLLLMTTLVLEFCRALFVVS